MKTYAIGDVHGCFDTLEQLLQQIDQLKELAFLASGGDEAVSEKYASWIPARVQYESLFYDRDLQCVFQKKR